MSTLWTPEKIENYKQASEYTSFHKKLSVLAAPYLDKRWTLVDIGCGPGLLDFWLAPMVTGIDAIDSDAAAIGDLKERLDDVFLTDRRTAEKIRPRHMSFMDIDGESWDVALMCFLGIDTAMFKTALALAKRRILVFMHGRPDADGPLASSNDGGKLSAAELEDLLNTGGFKFKKNIMEMQFGQPFKSLEDIHRFLSAYGGDDAEKRMTDAEERIVKTNRFDYPYYLPKSISVAAFVILAGQTAGT